MRRLVVLTGILAIALSAQSGKTPEERAAALVLRMTLDEKVSQMQNAAPAIPRLEIPAYDWWNEALHGVARAGLATVFPQAIGLAATWDTDLQHRVADTISTEARAKYNDAILHDNRARYRGLTFWSPNINIFRDPRWGRGQETYGEDPFLTAEMAIAFVKGMQGDDPYYLKTIATPKHFAVHSGPEKTRHGFNADVSESDLNDTYLYAFRRTVTEAGAQSVMCAYNSIDGVPACANTMLLQEHLRKAWHFQGYVVSDCGAVDDILEGHRYTQSLAEASAMAVKAGTDLTCGTEYKSLVEAVRKNLISEAEIDRAVRRLFVARFRLGMFDPPSRVPFSTIKMDQVASSQHQKLALEAAEKSIVLLKNTNHFLPLKRPPGRIAVVGPAADDPDVLLGNYNGTPRSIVTPLEGIRKKFEGHSSVSFALGSVYAHSSTALIQMGAFPSGLVAEYFDNENFAGTPALTRIEPRGYFYREMSDPAVLKAIPTSNFSARWTGMLRVKTGGDYELGFARQECDSCVGTNALRLFFDDRLLVEESGGAAHGNESKSAPVHLAAGHAYRVRLEYVQEKGGSGIELVWTPPADSLLSEAVEAARSADLTVAVIGLNSRLEGEELRLEIPGFDHGDRTDLRVPEEQDRLLKVLLDTGKPVLVILVNGSALAVNLAQDRAVAVIESWYGGQEAGAAIANTLTGDNNPAGRLPVTFYNSVSQLPPFSDYSMNNRTYRNFKGKPLYPFGYGLSYSEFRYSNLRVNGLTASATVENVSSRNGDEVSQLYVLDASAHPELRGFTRVHLHAHESHVVSFPLEDEFGVNKVSIGGGQPSQ